MKTKAFDKIDWRSRYQEAHEQWSKKANAIAYNDGHYSMKEYPKVKTANGLTSMIMDFLWWNGWPANRINTQGQYTEQKYRGLVIMKGWRPSQTRKGTADIIATINGKTCWLEIKAGYDKPSTYQIAEQERQRAGGAIYEFIRSAEEFFTWYDMNVEIWK